MNEFYKKILNSFDEEKKKFEDSQKEKLNPKEFDPRDLPIKAKNQLICYRRSKRRRGHR